MEDPQSWDLLTSSLAASRLQDTMRTWSFLVLQGLLRPDNSAREIFELAIEDVLAVGEITGPSMPLRVAHELQRAGITTPLASQPDPWAEIAKARSAVIEKWNET